MFNKKDIKKIGKGILISSLIILGTAGVYAGNTSIKAYIDNFSSSESELGKLITTFFDSEGFIKSNFIKDGSISSNKLSENYQHDIQGACADGKVIKEIKDDGTIICIAASADNMGNHKATQNLDMNGKNIIGANSIEENGTLLSNKYLGKNSKATDSFNSDKLDGHISSYFQKDITGACSVGEAIKEIKDDGTIVCGNAGSDNLGNHKATQDLNMNGNNIIGANSIKENGTLLSNKYLGKTSKATDSDKLDGISSEGFVLSGSTYTKNEIDNKISFKKNGNNISYTDGNVGIGTTNPKEKLDINGNIAINGKKTIQEVTEKIRLGGDINHYYPVIINFNGPDFYNKIAITTKPRGQLTSCPNGNCYDYGHSTNVFIKYEGLTNSRGAGSHFVQKDWFDDRGDIRNCRMTIAGRALMCYMAGNRHYTFHGTFSSINVHYSAGTHRNCTHSSCYTHNQRINYHTVYSR